MPKRGVHPRRLARLAGVQVLLADLRRGDVLHDRPQVRAAHHGEDLLHELEHRRAHLEAEVEGLAGQRLVGRQPLGQGQVGFRRVLHVQEVAHELAVAADHERLVAQRRPDDAGDQPAEVEVAAAEEVAAAHDGGPQAEGARVHGRDEVRAALRHVVREPALQRVVLAVRQVGRVAVGLVGGRDEHLLHARAAARPRGGSRCRGRSPRACRPGRPWPRRRGSARRGGRPCRSNTRRRRAQHQPVVGERATHRRDPVEPAVPREKSCAATPSRTSATTCAPLRTSSGTTQLPSNPVAPVTRTGRPFQKTSKW